MGEMCSYYLSDSWFKLLRSNLSNAPQNWFILSIWSRNITLGVRKYEKCCAWLPNIQVMCTLPTAYVNCTAVAHPGYTALIHAYKSQLSAFRNHSRDLNQRVVGFSLIIWLSIIVKRRSTCNRRSTRKRIHTDPFGAS